MKKIHEKILRIKHPELYKKIYFECGSGWFDILDKVAEKIERLETAGKIRIEPSQIKEKFGSMRYYYYEMHRATKDKEKQRIFSDIISDVIHKAETETENTCEQCGKFGSINNTGWLQCLCDPCRTKQEQERAERLKK